MQAFAAQDGTTVARLTCRAGTSDAQNTRLLSQALGLGTPNFGAGGGQPTYDVSGLKYQTTVVETTTARVRVSGSLRAVTGMTSQVLPLNSTIGLTREQEQWRVCDAPGGGA